MIPQRNQYLPFHPQILMQAHPTLRRANVNDIPTMAGMADIRPPPPTRLTHFVRPIGPSSDPFLSRPIPPFGGTTRAPRRRRSDCGLERGAAGPHTSDRAKAAEGSMLPPEPGEGRSLPMFLVGFCLLPVVFAGWRATTPLRRGTRAQPSVAVPGFASPT